MSLSEQIAELEQKYENLLTEYEETKQDLKDFKSGNAYDDLKYKCKYLAEDNAVLEEENTALTKEVETTRLEVEQEIKEMINEVDSLEDKLFDAETKMYDFKQTLLSSFKDFIEECSEQDNSFKLKI